MLALSRMDRFARMVVLGLLAFSGSFLLGESYLPTVSYFWGLGTGRLLLCLALLLLPATDAGRFRPLLIGLAAGSLIVSTMASPLIFTRWVFVTLLYLLLEVAIDALVLTRATEQEIPLELGWLAACRLLGLWLGLFLQHSSLADKVRPQELACWLLIALTLFWVVSQESSADSFLPRSLKQHDSLPRERLGLQFRALIAPWNLVAVSALLCYACLAGFHAGALLPYPLLHPDGAGLWMAGILGNLSMLGVGLLGMVLLERLPLRFQLLLAATSAWVLLLPHILTPNRPPEPVWGLLLLGILLSSRAVLREVYRVDPVLRAALVVTAWTVGGLSGEILATSAPNRIGPALGLFFATGATLAALGGWRRYPQKSREVLTPIPPVQNEARFGDRMHDFEAAPTVEKKSRRPKKWKRAANYLLVHAPMYALTLILLLGGLKFGSYVYHHKADWEKRLEDATHRFQTELFFSGFARRLNEEMIASQRVPGDMRSFINQSFRSKGKPLSDVDLWGTPYRIENTRGEVFIRSAGPDRVFDTSDDLERSVPKPEGVK